MTILNAESIDKSYLTGKKTLQVLSDINLTVAAGDLVTVMGQSGSGKSTLLNIIGTLDKPDRGSLTVCGKSIAELGDTELSAFRNRHIGFVFQFHHLLPEFTARENLIIPAQIAGKKTVDGKVVELLDYFGLTDRQGHFPTQLSGGERQRLALCRALINEPDVLLADEPTGNLDIDNAEKLMQYIEGLRKDFKQTILITTHNPVIASMGNKRLILENKTLQLNHSLPEN